MRRVDVTASGSSARSRHAIVVMTSRSPAILAAVVLAWEPTSSGLVVRCTDPTGTAREGEPVGK